jgi:prepilin-type N-terminal cleavage/methylation domain-containing protein
MCAQLGRQAVKNNLRLVMTNKFCFNKGFSLLEILLVLGLVVVLASGLTAVSFTMYASYNVRLGRDTVLGHFLKARSKAQSGQSEKGLGVRVEQNKITLYKGGFQEGESSNEVYSFPDSITVSSETLPLNVFFNSLSGESQDVQITLHSESFEDFNISINHAGAILW